MTKQLVARVAIFASLTCIIVPKLSHAITWGTNLHLKPTLDVDQALMIMDQRNIRALRLNINFDSDISKLRVIISNAKTKGIKVIGLFYSSYQWKPVCDTTDLVAVEQTAYSQARAVVNNLKDVVTDWEMQNETDLGGPCPPKKPGSLGRLASDFDTMNGRYYAAILRGISKAIAEIKASSHINLVRILNYTYINTGLLDFMLSKGVAFEELGYHYYYAENVNPYKVSGPDGFYNLFSDFAKYGRPVAITEFNSAEIYSPRDGIPYDQTKSLRSLRNHLDYILTQSTANIREVYSYELLDEPEKGAVEGNFGLMTTLSTPKSQLYLFSAYTGGSLSQSERTVLTSAELLTHSKIDSLRVIATSPRTITDSQYIYNLFYLLLGRTAEPTALTYFINLLSSGYTREQVQSLILSSAEYARRVASGNYAPAPETNKLNNAEFVYSCYMTLLRRFPDTNGLISWSNGLEQGATRAHIVQSFLASPEYQRTFN